MKRSIKAGLTAGAIVLGWVSPTLGEDAGRIVEEHCATCHSLTELPSDDLKARQERIAPPLAYAGNKFRKEWIAGWLQKPTRLRPAGDFPPAHVQSSEQGDGINEESLPIHPSFDAEVAEAAADHLATLRPHNDLIAAETYTPGKVPERLGAMDFIKFKGCGACHEDAPGYGGVSGPELYTAWQRLQPEFIVSYIRNPTKWEPRSLMPVKHLKTEQIHKLADYLHTIGDKGEEAK